jgi:UrcA family protein
MSRSIIFAAALAVASIAAGAHAQDQVLRLDVKAYDLNKPADAQKVYTQLSKAVTKACNKEHEVFASDEAERFDLCYRDTMAKAVAQTNSPLLAQLNGDRVPTVRVAGR